MSLRYVDDALQLAHAELALHLYLFAVEESEQAFEQDVLHSHVADVFAKVSLQEVERDDLRNELSALEDRITLMPRIIVSKSLSVGLPNYPMIVRMICLW